MSSFRLKIDPKKRAVARFIGDVRIELQRILDARAKKGLNKSKIAERLVIHRSAITRRLNGAESLTLRTVAELAWAMDGEPKFYIADREIPAGSNHINAQAIPTASTPVPAGSGSKNPGTASGILSTLVYE